ncbi:MAG: recombinase family protein, partial [Gammaproteobacteria bacterium]
MNRSKIHERHLERQAFVYIRQSSMRQVKEHLESQDLQYQLLKRAQEFGWAAHQVTLLDDDLGKSGTSSQERMGFQNLVAAVGLRQVGIVLVTDVSRLARNCADWYQLLDLASMCDTLISDASGIYDPQHYNDRLLLGLKGTFSEVQWYQMREQLHAALLNKAKRGELVIRLPVGYEWLEDGRVAKVADQEVQRLIELVFAQFERLGTGRAVLNYLRTHKLQIPRAIHTGVDKGRIRWALPTSSAIYQFLKHPAYAGAYTYGKTRHVRLPGGGRQTKLERKPLKSWSVVLKKAFPAYIAWEQYMQNQEKLRQNAQTVFQSTGAPRQGAALLQGVVLCARCGRRMRAVYNRSPAYVCRSAHNQYGEPRCQYFTAPPIDAAVSELFLQAIAPARLEAALAAVDEIESQRQRLAEQWQLRLERARYQAQLAQRRYEQVDPDNRLVADSLEAVWNDKLRALRQAQEDSQHGRQELHVPG